jgi:hypothetical protein
MIEASARFEAWWGASHGQPPVADGFAKWMLACAGVVGEWGEYPIRGVVGLATANCHLPHASGFGNWMFRYAGLVGAWGERSTRGVMSLEQRPVAGWQSPVD